MKDYIILMADIVHSGQKDMKQLKKQFDKLIQTINKTCQSSFLSPMTITLGDEFQSVVASLKDGVNVIIKLEELIIEKGYLFKLRYVIVEGKIDTPINKKIAYGMMGEGLSVARATIEEIKKGKTRFNFKLKDNQKSKLLGNCFLLYTSLVDNWKPTDYSIISAFLKNNSYQEVAIKLKKDVSLMWKRRNTLKIDDYFSLKEIITDVLIKV